MNDAIIERKSREMYEKIRASRPQLNITGTAYYVSADGNDQADGLSPETAWKTPEGVNTHLDDLQVGDAVLFRCGDVFRGRVNLKKGITYSSFGEGEKPHLYAATCNAVTLNWKEEKENVYSVEIPDETDIGCIVFNHGEAWGYKKMPTDPEVALDLDFYHDLDAGKLYLYSEKGNPAERWTDIELCPRIHNMSGNCPDGCTVDGLVIKYGGAHGISMGSLDYNTGGKPRHENIYNVTIRNCEFEWIGGSIQHHNTRFGNGFEIWGGCDGLLIENCYFNQCYDAAVTQQYQGTVSDDKVLNIENVTMRDNLIENSTYSYEYFLTEFKDETRAWREDSESTFRNILFENNICRNAGYGWGNQRPDRRTASHLKSWGHHNKAENFIVKNNIFDRGDYRLIETHAYNDESLPTLIGNTYCQYLGKPIVCRQQTVSVMNEDTVKNNTIGNAEEDAIICIARR